jgi:WD40 repeat protein
LSERLFPAVFVAVLVVGVLTGVYGLVSVRRVEASIGLVLCAVPLVLLWGSLPSDVLGSDTADLGVESVAFGVVEGRTVLASGSEDRTVRLWDPATGKQIGEPLTGHDEWVESVAFGTVDGRTVLASGGDNGKVRLWDPATGKQIGEPLTGHDESVQSVAFGMVDGRTVLASGSWDETVRLWDPATGKQIRRLTGESWSF